MHEAFIYTPVGFAIACIMIGCLYFCCKKKNKLRNEAHFVMFGEPECCYPLKRKNAAPTADCGKYCKGKILREIEQSILWANSSICIAMFNFNNYKMRDYILHAKRHRGVQIRIIVDRSLCKKGDNRQAKELIDAGKIVLIRNNFIIFCIIFSSAIVP